MFGPASTASDGFAICSPPPRSRHDERRIAESSESLPIPGVGTKRTGCLCKAHLTPLLCQATFPLSSTLDRRKVGAGHANET